MDKANSEGISVRHLANGMRMVHKSISGTQVAHCGFVITAGSRDEEPQATGVAHFIEHMLFKGTKKRKPTAILTRMDEVGAELNAYTTREHTSIYSSFPQHYLGRAIDLLTDICFNSVFPTAEMQKEKKVILEEYEMYLDSPEESIYDEFSELLFAGHPIGNNILGTPDSIRNFKQNDLHHFIRHNYLPQHIVFSYVGSHTVQQVMDELEPQLAKLNMPSGQRRRKKPVAAKPFHVTQHKSFTQAHCMIGTRAYANSHKNRAALLLLNNYLGGPALNSRLNLSVREKYGYTYHIESVYTPYSDTGIFSIYTGTDPKYLDKCLELIFRELKILREQKLSPQKLKAAKRQFTGQISMAEENRSSLMLALGKSLSDFNRVDTLVQLFKKIEAVTADQLQEIANELLQEKQFSQLLYLPEK